jgi:hypothetical protein
MKKIKVMLPDEELRVIQWITICDPGYKCVTSTPGICRLQRRGGRKIRRNRETGDIRIGVCVEGNIAAESSSVYEIIISTSAKIS